MNDWQFTKDGNYTVKSGNPVTAATTGFSYRGMEGEGFYSKKLWSLKMPEKVKVFAWRAVKGILPVAENNVVKKEAINDARCKVCGEEGEVETSDHCFRFCHVARQVWLLSPLGLRSTTETQISYNKYWLANVSCCLDKEDLTLFFLLAWSIWLNRNNTICRGEEGHPIDIVRQAMNLFEECGGRATRRSQWHVVVAKPPCRLKPPEEGMVKVNVDGGVFGPLGGFIAAKARAILDELDYAKQLGFSKEGRVDDELYVQLEQAMGEARSLRREAFEESERRYKAEKDLIDANRRAKAAESVYIEELKQRKEIEAALLIEKEKVEKMQNQQAEVIEQLCAELDQKSLLESKIAASDEMVKELEVKIISAVGLLQNYKKARDELQIELDSALKVTEELIQNQTDSKCEAPEYFICPILQEVMKDPHVAADGYTYEAEALKGWFKTGRNTSPMTNLKLTHTNLVPNLSLRSGIQEWLQRQ